MIFLRAVPGGWIGTVPGFVAGVLGCRWADRGRISVYPRPNANSLQHLVCTVTTFGVLDCSYLKCGNLRLLWRDSTWEEFLWGPLPMEVDDEDAEVPVGSAGYGSFEEEEPQLPPLDSSSDDESDDEPGRPQGRTDSSEKKS